MKGRLFRSIGCGTGQLTCTVLPQAHADEMTRRRAAAAGRKLSSVTTTVTTVRPSWAARARISASAARSKPRAEA
jgi:hypothetical protein